MLKKEFSKKDVSRLRSLVKGQTGEKTTTSAGYTKQQVDRKEGDIWEEDGRTWTVKNGVKQNVSKLQELRKAGTFPLFCPDCSKKMSVKYDKPVYNIHRRCFDCQLLVEKDIKLSGKWDEYVNEIHNSEIDGLIDNYEKWVDDLINGSSDGFVTEQGDVERWGKADFTGILKQKEEAIEALKKLKK